MANLLKGKDVALEIINRSKEVVEKNNIRPCLAIFRLGEKDNDLSYERGIEKKASEVGLEIRKYIFKEDVDEEAFYQKLDEANSDVNIHGILIFRPFPKRFDDAKLRNYIATEKDVDGCGDGSLSGLLTNSEKGFAPATAKAAIEILDYYNVDVSGKNVTVLGRSLVIGKPVSLLLLNKNATVTICHSKTKDIEKIASNSDILICATGQMESIDKTYTNPNQTIIDVGISWNQEKGKLCGDVQFEEVEPLVKNITPVPGGVGSVTTAVLINNVVTACIRNKK